MYLSSVRLLLSKLAYVLQLREVMVILLQSSYLEKIYASGRYCEHEGVYVISS